jgi:amidase
MILFVLLLAALPVEERSIASLQAEMRAGKLTARALTEAYLARIAEIDPKLHSVIELNPDALAIAAALDDERKAKGARGPLHGIPVLVKDNIATGDRMETTAGSLALLGAKASRDAFVVERLRAAGAVVLGKTNLSEWANIRSTRSSSGFSARGGQTRNPYALDRSPCGSSSGTGAAIAASLAAAGVGTETVGSILCPSAMQALVGLKPTVGLVSRSGIVPISHTQDTAGPMARTVADLAALLSAMVGADAADPATAAAGKPVDYVQAIAQAERLDGVRIGIPRERVFGISPAADQATLAAIAALKARGAVIVDPADIPHLGEYRDAALTVMLSELAADLPKYLAQYAPTARVKTLGDVIAFNTKEAGRELAFFGQELFTRAASSGSLDTPVYQEALAKCRTLAREQGLDAVFSQHRLDALLLPTTAPAFPIDLVNGDHFVLGTAMPAAVAGYPAITVPAGEAQGLPLGVSFVGKAWSEAKLLMIAAVFEQATHHRKPPRYLTTVLLP